MNRRDRGAPPALGACEPEKRSSLDSPLEGVGFEPSVPLVRKALLGVANRRRRHERWSHLQVQARDGNACLEWLPIAFPFAEGPRVRIRLPPAESHQRTELGEFRPREGGFPMVSSRSFGNDLLIGLVSAGMTR